MVRNVKKIITKFYQNNNKISYTCIIFKLAGLCCGFKRQKLVVFEKNMYICIVTLTFYTLCSIDLKVIVIKVVNLYFSLFLATKKKGNSIKNYPLPISTNKQFFYLSIINIYLKPISLIFKSKIYRTFYCSYTFFVLNNSTMFSNYFDSYFY